MILYLVRHAEALPLGGVVQRDAERTLTPRGEDDARLMGKVIAAMDPVVKQLLTSPLVRGVRTAELIAGSLTMPPPVTATDNLAPGFRARALVDAISGMESRDVVIAVGHQPDLTRFISYLIADAAAEIVMPPGSVARLAVQHTGAEPEAMLTWLVTPDLARSLHPQL
jgi:phosphohistidine phosphatase